MATPEGTGLVTINGKPQKERGFNCMRLITYLTEDGVTDWERWHGAHIQAASGHCPYYSQCPNYKQAVEKYQTPINMEESKNKRTAILAKVGKVIAETLTALLTTIVSAVVVVILYVLYVPFGIGRALFNRQAIRGFYSDVFFVIDGIWQRMRKREQEA